MTGSRLRNRRPPCNLASRSEPPVRIELTTSSIPRKHSTTELWRRNPVSSPTVRKAAAGHVRRLQPSLLRTWYQTVCYYAQHSDGSTSGYAVTNPLSVSGDVRRASLLDMTGLPLSPRFRGIPWGLCMRLQRACCNTRRPRQARPPRDSLDAQCVPPSMAVRTKKNAFIQLFPDALKGAVDALARSEVFATGVEVMTVVDFRKFVLQSTICALPSQIFHDSTFPLPATVILIASTTLFTNGIEILPDLSASPALSTYIELASRLGLGTPPASL